MHERVCKMRERWKERGREEATKIKLNKVEINYEVACGVDEPILAAAVRVVVRCYLLPYYGCVDCCI